MSIAASELMKKQAQFEKITLKAVNVIFKSDFGKNAIRRVEELQKKFNPEISTPRRRKITVRTEPDPKRIIAWAVAQRVREARERQGLRQDDLAKTSGIARPNIVRLEQGRHIPTLPTLKRIADALGLDINSLMAKPTVTKRDKLEFRKIAESSLEEWGEKLTIEDAKA